MNSLEEATTGQILEELSARFRGVAFCGIRPDEGPQVEDDPEEGDELRFYYAGGLTLAYGLARRLKRFLDIEAKISEDSIEDASDEPEAEEEA